MPHIDSISVPWRKLMIAFIISIGWSCAGAISAELLTPLERAWLNANSEIRVAPDPDFPPIEYIDEKWQYQGIAADYLSLLEQKLDIHFTIVRLPSWDQVLTQARTREVDMFAAATSTPQREEYMTFTPPHLELPGVILVRTQVDQNLSLKDLYGLKVAVVSGYVWQELINHDHPDIKLEPVPDLLTGLKKLSFGSVDAMVANLATATYYIEKAGITNLRLAGESGYYGRYALAVRKDWVVLSGILEKGLAAITEAERAEILQRWIGLERRSLLDSKAFWISFLSSVAVLLVLMILCWNWLLRKRVAVQTADLRTELIQRKLAENAYQQSEQRYQTLFETASDAIFMMTGEHFIDCNDAATRMFGCSREEFLNQTPFNFSPDRQADGSDSYSKAIRLINETLKGMPQMFEWQHCCLDGTPFDAEVSLNSYRDDNNQFVLAIVRNITERKRIERLKDEFVSTVSHEIRTPLTSIRGSLDLISGGAVGKLPEQAELLLEIAGRNTERLLLLVNDLLDIQKLESGQIQFQLRPIDVSVFLKQAISSNQPYFDQYQVSLQLLAVEEAWHVMADTSRLMQVMNNLLSNAAKFSSPKSSVEVQAISTGNKLKISVIDHGAGIDASFQPFIFDRFTQADSSDKRKVGGTGLGLCISKAIILRHHGQIGFHCRPGNGTEFYFELPLLTQQQEN